MDLYKRLIALQAPAFRDFNAKLIPNIEKGTVLGVKTPELKLLAKELIKNGEAEEFLARLPHQYFEENQIHAFLISEIKDWDKAIAELERFLPYVDNWATCDQMILKVIAKDPERILDKAEEWIHSDHVYTIRFGIGLLMRYFLDEGFREEYLEKVAAIKSEEYYVNMMSAWYFATALAKQYEATLPYFTDNRLDKWVHNKSISKARESYRVSNEHKEILKLLIRKDK